MSASGMPPVLGQDGTLLLADGSELVLGVPITDNGLAKLVRRVILVSAMGATFYIVHFSINLMRGTYNPQNKQEITSLWAAMSSLLIELSIPACGYSGAVYSNKQMICCFCSCNLFIAIISVMSFIRLSDYYSDVDGCEGQASLRQKRTCEVWTSDGPDKYLMMGSMVLIIVIGFLAFWFGSMLYNRLGLDNVLPMPPLPLVGEVIALSPEAVAMIGVTARAFPPQVVPVAEPVGDHGATGSSGGGAPEEPGAAAIVLQVEEIPPDGPDVEELPVRPAATGNVLGGSVALRELHAGSVRAIHV